MGRNGCVPDKHGSLLVAKEAEHRERVRSSA